MIVHRERVAVGRSGALRGLESLASAPRADDLRRGPDSAQAGYRFGQQPPVPPSGQNARSGEDLAMRSPGRPPRSVRLRIAAETPLS